MTSFLRIRRRILRRALRFVLVERVYRRKVAVFLLRKGKAVHLVTGVIALVLISYSLRSHSTRHIATLKTYAETISANGTLPQMAIAVAAAMLGVIGIVFSLSIFSIQQVADRGTSLTLREYANDWVLRIIYLSLGAFALSELIVALSKKEFGIYAIFVNLAILAAAICLLKIYFNRAIKFSDPHFTVTKIATRARRVLDAIKRAEKAVGAEVRYDRSRKQA